MLSKILRIKSNYKPVAVGNLAELSAASLNDRRMCASAQLVASAANVAPPCVASCVKLESSDSSKPPLGPAPAAASQALQPSSVMAADAERNAPAAPAASLTTVAPSPAAAHTTTPPDTTSMFVISANIDDHFEYKGYHKFGRVLGKGSFGTVIECVRKCDQKPIALKFFKYTAIHKWIPESAVIGHLDPALAANSEFFSSGGECSQSAGGAKERMLPSEVACLIRASQLDGVVKILDFIPSSDNVYFADETGATSSSDSSLDSLPLDQKRAKQQPPRLQQQQQQQQQQRVDAESIIGIVLERNPSEICLFDYLIQKQCLDEAEARHIMQQIISTSCVLLQNGILHGDLKSENILIDATTKKIKLIDFGSAQLMDLSGGALVSIGSGASLHKMSGVMHKCNSQSMLARPVRTFRGTNLYKPPEFLLHHCFYPRPSTVWTFGIILFDMVCGHFPFEKDADVLSHQDREIEFTRPGLSSEFKDFVKKCLSFYVADRMVIEHAISHPWMKSKPSASA